MKEIGIDMEIHQKPKLLEDIPKVDIVVTMGCNVTCPIIPCQYREDWGLEDPTGKSDDEFRLTRNTIKSKMDDLIHRIQSGLMDR
jgi:arsenate reductase